MSFIKDKILHSFNGSPSPLWWRITKTIWVFAENSTIAILLYNNPSFGLTKGLAYYKIISSQFKDSVDSLLNSKSQEYAPKGASEALTKVTDTSTPKEAIVAINKVIK